MKDWEITVFHFRFRLASEAPLNPYRAVGDTQSWTEEDILVPDRIFLYSPDCPGIHYRDQAGLELRKISAYLPLPPEPCDLQPWQIL